MKSPRSEASSSVRLTSESIQRELAQLIVHLEGSTRGVDDARFRKIALKSTEVLKGLRTLFERLGSEAQTASPKRAEVIARDAKTKGRASAVAEALDTKKSAKKPTPPTKSNGVVATPKKDPVPVATPSAPKADLRGGKNVIPSPAPAPALPNGITPAAKPTDPDEIAAKARLQRQQARAPQRPGGQAAPKPLPPQSGKPIWSKPHSS